MAARRSTLATTSRLNTGPALGGSAAAGGAGGGGGISRASIGGPRPSLGGKSFAPLAGSSGSAAASAGGFAAGAAAVGSGSNGAAGAAGGAAIPSGRASMSTKMSLGGGRRSSTFGTLTGSSGAKDDPRPLKSAAFQRDAQLMIIEYLTTHMYDHPISQKTMMRPTTTDFYNIMKFLILQVDPHWKFSASIGDDITTFFKALNYPYMAHLAKSTLSAVNSPHAWPQLLAALLWVVELCKYAECTQGADETDEDGQFWSYLTISYKAYMADDDSKCEALDNHIASTFEARQATLTDEINRFQTDIAAVTKEIASLTRDSSVATLRSTKADMTSDLHKFNRLIEQLKVKVAQLQSAKAAREVELNDKKAEVARLKSNIADLQARVQSQDLSAADVARMMQERTIMKEGLAKAAAAHEEAQKGLWQTRTHLNKLMDELHSTMQSYHNTAAALHLLPRTAKYAKGVDFELHINHDFATSSSHQQLLMTDVNGVIKPALRDLKASFTQLMHEARSVCLELQERVEQCEEAREEAKGSISAVDARVSKMEDGLKREKEALERYLSEKRVEMEILEADIERSREIQAGLTRVDPQLSDGALAKLRSEAQEQDMLLQAERKAMQTKIIALMNLLTDHKSFVEQRIREQISWLETKAVEASL